jgi:hypothetical protein
MDKPEMKDHYIQGTMKTSRPKSAIYHAERMTLNKDGTQKITYLITAENTKTTYYHEFKKDTDWQKRIEVIRADYENYERPATRTNNKTGEKTKFTKKQKMQKSVELYKELEIGFGSAIFEQICPQKIEKTKDKDGNEIIKNVTDTTEIEKLLKSYCGKFEEKTGAKVVFSSLHMDEGHKVKDENGNETGELKFNYHAHILIENYNFNTHTTARRATNYKAIQTELAEHFQINGIKWERGKDYKKENETCPENIGHQQFRKQKIEDEKNQIWQKQKQQLIDEFKEFLADEKITDLTQLKKIYSEQKSQIIQYGKDNPEDKVTKKEWDEINANYQRLKQEKEHLENQLKSSIRTNKDLLDKLTHADTINNRLNSEKTALQNELLAIQSLKRLEIEKQEQKAREKTELLKSNDTVLAYYAKINPELVEKVKRNRYLEVPGVNGGIVQLSDNDPHRLAELLGKVTGHKISALNEESLENRVKGHVYSI